MIPDYQSLMRPVLTCAEASETRISDVVELLADKLALTAEERAQLLPSGKQTRFANRVNWAKAYLAKAGLVENTRRGYFRITPRGQAALADAAATINNAYLDQFKEFQDFKAKVNEADGATAATPAQASAPFSAQGGTETPDEALRKAHGAITAALAADLLDRVRQATPAFFEKLIVELLLAMGYGGTSEEAGRALGQSGDDGVDGVIDQDPLGVDQIFVQAKRLCRRQQHRRRRHPRLLRRSESEEGPQGHLRHDVGVQPAGSRDGARARVTDRADRRPSALAADDPLQRGVPG